MKKRDFDNVALINPNKPASVHAVLMNGAVAVGRNLLCEKRAATTTKSGLILPDVVVQGLGWVVVSVGSKVADTIGDVVQPGDRIMFKGGAEMKLGDRAFAFVDVGQIMFRLDRDTASKYFDAPDAEPVLLGGTSAIEPETPPMPAGALNL